MSVIRSGERQRPRDRKHRSQVNERRRSLAFQLLEARHLLACDSPPCLTANLDPTVISEDGGRNAALLWVQWESAGPEYVEFKSLDTTEVEVQNIVYVPDGYTRVGVYVGAVDDGDIDGPQDVGVEISAPGFQSTTVTITVLDNDQPPEYLTRWQNPLWQFDVNDDANTSPLDALIIVNSINRDGIRDFDIPYDNTQWPATYYDVNDDGALTPIDALQVINWMNRMPATAETETVLDVDSGRFQDDQLTNQAGVRLFAETAQSQVDVRFNNGPIVKASSLGGGWFSALPSDNFPIEDGEVRVTSVVTTTDGRVAQNRFVYELDRSPPSLDIGLSSSSQFPTATGQSPFGVVSLVGQTEPLAWVNATGVPLPAQASMTGAVEIRGIELAPGNSVIELNISDSAGNNANLELPLLRVDSQYKNPVLFWNAQARASIQADATAAPIASRLLGMLHLVINDVVNAIDDFRTKRLPLHVDTDLNLELALASAASAFLSAAVPSQSNVLSQIFDNVRQEFPDSAQRDASIRFGEFATEKMLSLYPIEMWNDITYFDAPAGAGNWVATAPAYEVAQLPVLRELNWITGEPLAIEALAPAPPSLDSAEYAAAYNQVRNLGSATSTTRTEEQTLIARFWADGAGSATPAGHWNAIASEIAAADRLSTADAARMLFELNSAISDAAIAAWIIKYGYHHWRPITAIAEADVDGNPATEKEANWVPLVATPAHPEYVSGHSTISAAAANVLSRFFGDQRNFETSSVGVPGVVRAYDSFEEAAQEAGMSRIYGGIHFEYSNQQGQVIGKMLGERSFDRLATFVDVLAPEIFLPNRDVFVNSRDVTWTGWVLDDLVGVESLVVTINGTQWREIARDAGGQFEIAFVDADELLQEGTNEIELNATDYSGKKSEPLTLDLVLDSKPPEIQLDSPQLDESISDLTRLSGVISSIDAPIAQFTFQWDQGEVQTVSWNRSNGTFNQSLGTSRLQPGEHELTIVIVDMAGNQTTLQRTYQVAPSRFTVERLSPEQGATNVGVTYRPQITFSQPVDRATLNSQTFYAIDTSGATIDSQIIYSSDNKSAWLFFQQPLPSGSSLKIVLDGDQIAAPDGLLLDADRDGNPGGVLQHSFTTARSVPLPGTSLVGKVVDPGPDLVPFTYDDAQVGPDNAFFTSDDLFLRPIEGVKVFVLGMEDQWVLTNSQGEFNLPMVPAGVVKLAVDGRTATNSPEGYFFPEMVFDLDVIPGRINTVMGTSGDPTQREVQTDRREVYLPRVSSDSLQQIADSGTTRVVVDAKSVPQLNPDQREQVELIVPAGSAIGEDGRPLVNARVGINTVPPELVRDMLPPGLLQHTFDLTIQSPGTAVFADPLQLKLPNIFNEPPGTKLNFLSFDHTTGRLVIEGTATVAPDGLSVSTDLGTGVTKPGWHGLTSPGNRVLARPGENCYSGTREEAYQQLGDALSEAGSFSFDAGRSIADSFEDLGDVEDIGYFPGLTQLGKAFDTLFFVLDIKQQFDNIRTVANPNASTWERIKAASSIAAFVSPAGRYKTVLNILNTLSDFNDARQSLNAAREQIVAVRDLPPCSSLSSSEFADLVDSTIKELDELKEATREISEQLDSMNNYMDAALERLKILDEAASNLGLSASDRAVLKQSADGAEQAIQAITNSDSTDRGFEGTVDSFNKLADAVSRPLPTGDSADNAASTPTSSSTRSPSGNPLYWVAEFGDTIVRGRNASSEQIEVFAPPLTWIHLAVYDPVTGNLADKYVRTAEAGGITSLGTLPLRDVSMLPDADSDGLPDLSEFIVGTDIYEADSDGDGISDANELQSADDPLSGVVSSEGILAFAELKGNPNSVEIATRGNRTIAYVATGSFGLGVVDVTNPFDPLVISELDLPGNASDLSIDPLNGNLAVATETGGLHILDLQNLAAPNLTRHIDINASHVRLIGDVAIVATGQQLRSYDVTTGVLLDEKQWTGLISDLERDGNLLIVMCTDRTLRTLNLDRGALVEKGSLGLPAYGELFLAEDVVYVAAEGDLVGGYLTVDVTDDANPRLIKRADSASIASKRFVLRSNARGISVGSPGNLGRLLQIVDSSDPSKTDRFISQVELAGEPLDVAMVGATAVVAIQNRGLTIVNTMSRDTGQNPPTIEMNNAFEDIAGDFPGIQIAEGQPLVVRPKVRDDFQVARVELLINGAVTNTSVQFPFVLETTLPTGIGNVEVQIRAIDTSGNSFTTSTTNVMVIADSLPPEIIEIAPHPDTILYSNSQSLYVAFSEPIDPASWDINNFGLTEPISGQVIRPISVSPRGIGAAVDLLFEGVGAGRYDFTIDGNQVRDVAGLPLLGAPIRQSINVGEWREPGESIATALPLGTIASEYRISGSLATESDPYDYYAFSLDSPSYVTISLTGLSAATVIQLIRDLDGDGVVDANEDYIWVGSTSTLEQTRALLPGNYVVRMWTQYGGQSTDYELGISPTDIIETLETDPGESLQSARQVGALQSEVSIDDIVMAGVDDSDFYAFSVDKPRSVSMSLSRLGANAVIQLIRDLNSDGTITNDEIYAIQGSGGVLTLTRDLLPGTYFIRVDIQYGGSSSPYTLTITPNNLIPVLNNDPADQLVAATNLGKLNGQRVVSDILMAGVDDVDVFAFSLDQPYSVTVGLSGMSVQGFFEVIRDLNNDGSVTNNEVYALASSVSPFSRTQELFPGNYFVRVSLPHQGTSSRYSLSLALGDQVPLLAEDPGTELTNAFDLGAVSSAVEATDALMAGVDDMDVFRFSLTEPKEVTIAVSGTNEQVQFELVRDTDANGEVSNNEIYSVAGVIGQASRVKDLLPGSYFVRVFLPHSRTSTPYTLLISPGQAIPLLNIDPGATLGGGFDLGTLSQPVTVSDMVMSDVDGFDVYRFAVPTNGSYRFQLFGVKEQLRVELIRDTNQSGEVDAGEIVAVRIGSGDFEWNQLLDSSEYFLRISTANSRTSSRYRLAISIE